MHSTLETRLTGELLGCQMYACSQDQIWAVSNMSTKAKSKSKSKL